MVQACGRCGTFAELESNGFRALCGPCWQIARSRLELPTRSPVELVLRVLTLVRQNWLPTLTAVLILVAPEAVHQLSGWGGARPTWSVVLYDRLIGSAVEALLLAFVSQRTFGGEASFDSARRLATSRYLSVVVVNLLINLPSLAGDSVWLAKAMLNTVLNCAIPLTLCEGLGPFGAIRESVRRSKALFWPLLSISIAKLVAVLGPFIVLGAFLGRDQSQVFMAKNHAAALWLSVAVLGLAHGLSILLQVVVWGATRPPDWAWRGMSARAKKSLLGG